MNDVYKLDLSFNNNSEHTTHATDLRQIINIIERKKLIEISNYYQKFTLDFTDGSEFRKNFCDLIFKCYGKCKNHYTLSQLLSKFEWNRNDRILWESELLAVVTETRNEIPYFLQHENNNEFVINFIQGYVIQELDKNILFCFDNNFKKPTSYLFTECFKVSRNRDAQHCFLNISLISFNALHNAEYHINKEEGYFIEDFNGKCPMHFYSTVSGDGIIDFSERLFIDTKDLKTADSIGKNISFWDKLKLNKVEPALTDKKIIKKSEYHYLLSPKYFWQNFIDNFKDSSGYSVKKHFETAMNIEIRSFLSVTGKTEYDLIKKSDITSFRNKIEQVFRSLLGNFGFNFSNSELTELFKENYNIENILPKYLRLVEDLKQPEINIEADTIKLEQ